MPRMFLRKSLTLILSASVLFFAGCASVDQPDANGQTAIEASRKARNVPALAEASYQTKIVCRATEPLSVNTPFKSKILACEPINAQATIEELRDAGWRTESVDIGRPENINGVVGMTLQITLRKIF